MTLITHLEVVLGDWQQLPDTLLKLSEEWKYLDGSIYTIAHTEIERPLSSEEETLFIRLQEQGAILVGSSRSRQIPAEGDELPKWAEP